MTKVPRKLIFLTHAQGAMDPEVPVPDWPLNTEGHARHAAFAQSDTPVGVTALYSSTERKARDGAAPLADALNLTPRALETLGENDRSSTGFMPPSEFEPMADAFFANPDTQVRGWESARAAQARIVAAVGTLAALDGTAGDILIVAHGAVGALMRCHLKRIEITRGEDQSAGGGFYFTTNTTLSQPPSDWIRI